MACPYTIGIGRQPYRDKINPFKATTLESGIPELRLYHDVHVEHAIFTLSTEFHDWRRAWVLDVSEIRLDREPATDALNSRSRDHGKNDPRRNRQARSKQRPHAHSLPPGESALVPRPSSGSRCRPAGRPSNANVRGAVARWAFRSRFFSGRGFAIGTRLPLSAKMPAVRAHARLKVSLRRSLGTRAAHVISDGRAGIRFDLLQAGFDVRPKLG